MPVKELIRSLVFDMARRFPPTCGQVSDGLIYRDFITVGVLLKKLKVIDKESDHGRSLIRDNWIYVQEPDVLVGRMQIFNNWSPYMVADPSTRSGSGWNISATTPTRSGASRTTKMIAARHREWSASASSIPRDVLDAHGDPHAENLSRHISAPTTASSEIRDYFDRFENLFLVGRNGMHNYNNQDHSMLTAMTAVDNISPVAWTSPTSGR